MYPKEVVVVNNKLLFSFLKRMCVVCMCMFFVSFSAIFYNFVGKMRVFV